MSARSRFARAALGTSDLPIGTAGQGYQLRSTAIASVVVVVVDDHNNNNNNNNNDC